MPTENRFQFTPKQLDAIGNGFEDKRPEDVLRWGFDTFGDNIGLGSSFGGASGAVLVDMAAKINPGLKVFYLDTDFLFPETYAQIDEAKKRYGITPIAYKSKLTPEEQGSEFGDELWQRDPDLCCDLRKVEPNVRALAGLDAWITGIRRDQAQRQSVGIVEWNQKFKLVKVNPVAHWTKKQTWEYLLTHGVPYNPLLDQGYKSIGCTYCTTRVGSTDDERAGRWPGTDKTECGLHS